MNYRIRQARADDLAALADIEHSAAAQFLDVGLAGDFVDSVIPLEVHQLACDEGRLWVAVDGNDHCVGFALALVLDDGTPLLQEIDVEPRHGRRGLGRRLVAAVTDWARDRRARALVLSTFRDVPWNAPFYAGLGFAIVAEGTLSAAERDLREDEAAHGLPLADRVVMRLDLTVPRE